MRLSRLSTVAVAASLLVVMVAACSSSAGTPDRSSSADATRQTSSPTSASTSGSGSIAAGLLTTTDVTGYTPMAVSDDQTPLPCTPTQKPLQLRYPPSHTAKAQFESTSKQSQFGETLLGYASTSVADRTYVAAQQGFGCTSGKSGSSTLKIVKRGTITQDGGRGERWDIAFSDGTLGTAVIGQVGATFIGLTFVATKSGANEVDPGVVLQKALAKVAANG